jgi:hypothetical protein
MVNQGMARFIFGSVLMQIRIFNYEAAFGQVIGIVHHIYPYSGMFLRPIKQIHTNTLYSM